MRLAPILRWTVHLLLFGLCLEVAARLDDRLSFGAPWWSRYDADLLRETDADGLRRNVPGARFEKWKVNSLGFRGEELQPRDLARRPRVACLGQSESFGLFESEGGEWPLRLARLLRVERADAEVFNASVVGLGRQARQAYLDKYVLPLRPDVLVLYFNVLSDAGYRPADPPRGAGSPGQAAATVRATVSPWEGWAASRVLPKLRQRVRAALPDALWRPVREWRLGRTLHDLERRELGGRPPLDALPADVLASFDAHLRAVVLALRQRGVIPVLATYPTLGTAENRSRYRVEFLDERVWHVELSELGMVDAAARLNDVIRRVARELGVTLADVDVAMPRTSEYFADYVHYTDRGAELVAECVLDALQHSGVLDRAMTPATASRAGTAR